LFNPPPCACAALTARNKARKNAVEASQPARSGRVLEAADATAKDSAGAPMGAVVRAVPVMGMVDLPAIVMY
jgi:hypothetical protein